VVVHLKADIRTHGDSRKLSRRLFKNVVFFQGASHPNWKAWLLATYQLSI
jgi:hypothetical protein